MRGGPGGPPRPRPHTRSSLLLARVPVAHLLDLLQDLVKVVTRRLLERREVLVGHQFLLPEKLPDGKQVPVVEVSRASPPADCAWFEKQELPGASVRGARPVCQFRSHQVTGSDVSRS